MILQCHEFMCFCVYVGTVSGRNSLFGALISCVVFGHKLDVFGTFEKSFIEFS